MLEISIDTSNPLKLKLSSKYATLLREVREYFTEFAPGYQFQWKYKSGRWDGRVSVFDSKTRTLPYGLIFDLLKFKREYYPNDKWKVDPKIKDLFNGKEDFDWNWDLKYVPRDYQMDCIKTALARRSGILAVGTSGGKSLIIAYIWKHLYEAGLVNKFFIVVPNLNLITQFKNDLIDYGINEDLIGEVWAGKKEWDKDLVISTWQSLAKNLDKLNSFDGVFWDEVHNSTGTLAQELLSGMHKCVWRWGCTGTLADERLNDLNVRSYVGPVLRTYDTTFLRENGYVAPCTVHQIEVNYIPKFKRPNKKNKLYITENDEFSKAKDELFSNTFRLNVIKDQILKIKDNTKLILVDKVETGGVLLKEFLEMCSDLSDHEIVFMYGKTKKGKREEHRQQMIADDKKIIYISTYPILQAGVNAPPLKHVFFASPSKSKIRVLQSCGRVIRLHEMKDRAHVYDFVDTGVSWFERQSYMREQMYLKSSFDIETYEYYEKDFQF